jgi:hypothetical protein
MYSVCEMMKDTVTYSRLYIHSNNKVCQTAWMYMHAEGAQLFCELLVRKWGFGPTYFWAMGQIVGLMNFYKNIDKKYLKWNLIQTFMV